MIPERDIPAAVALRDRFGITAKEAATLLLFLRGLPVEAERIRDTYCDSPRSGLEAARHWAKRVRAKSRGAITIKHDRGIGYRIPAETLARVRAVVKEARQ